MYGSGCCLYLLKFVGLARTEEAVYEVLPVLLRCFLLSSGRSECVPVAGVRLGQGWGILGLGCIIRGRFREGNKPFPIQFGILTLVCSSLLCCRLALVVFTFVDVPFLYRRFSADVSLLLIALFFGDRSLRV